MRFSIILFTFLVTCSFIYRVPCEKLKNGNYKVVLDNNFKNDYGEFEFDITDSVCLLRRKESIEHLNITWLPNCGFRLKNCDSSTLLTDFQKALSSIGDPYYDIIKVKKDTAYFIYRVNLHIQIFSGRLIKISE
jgi:hypothetical protein